MNRGILIGLALLSACGDPEIHVVFNVPARYREAITAADLRVLEPPVAQPFSCDDLAFGTVAPELVRLSQVLEIGARGSEQVPIGDLDRLAPKLLVADGLDDSGRRLVTACAELGAIEETVDLELQAEPIAVVTATGSPDLRFDLSNRTPRPVMIAVRDQLGQAIPGARARWSILGAGQSGSNGDAEADENGVISLQTAPPDRAGPLVLAVRVRWAESEPLRLSGAVSPPKEILRLNGRAIDYVSGRIGPAGELGVAALTETAAGLRVAIVYRSNNGPYVYRTSDLIDSSAVMTLIEGSPRDRILVVTRGEWIYVSGDGALDTRPYDPIFAGLEPISLVRGELCAAGNAPRVMVNFTLGGGINTVGLYDENGAQLDHFLNALDIQIPSSGCVDTQKGAVRTFLVSTGSFGMVAVAQPSIDTIHLASWIALDFGVGFSDPIDSSGRLMLGTQINVDDIVISRVQLQLGDPAEREMSLSNRGTDIVPFTPQYTFGGEVDGDRKLDVVTLLYEPGVSGEPDRFHVWSILGIDDGGKRIAGPVIANVTTLGFPRLMLGDFDNDGIDDVVLGGRPDDPAAMDSVIEIYSMGRTAP